MPLPRSLPQPAPPQTPQEDGHLPLARGHCPVSSRVRKGGSLCHPETSRRPYPLEQGHTQKAWGLSNNVPPPPRHTHTHTHTHTHLVCSRQWAYVRHCTHIHFHASLCVDCCWWGDPISSGNGSHGGEE